MIRVRYVMLDHVTNDLFKLVVVVVLEFYIIIMYSSNKMYLVDEIDKNRIRNEQI